MKNKLHNIRKEGETGEKVIKITLVKEKKEH
jgi:hypothetical protein